MRRELSDKHERGFTLIEVMITVAILAILSGLAAPSFSNLVLNQRVKAAVSDVYASLVFTRSEALKRNGAVTITRSGSAWANGWNVQAGGADLRVQSALSGLTLTPASDQTVIAYRQDGRLDTRPPNMPAPAFVLSIAGNNSVTARCVTVDPSGRPNVRVDSNNNAADGCN